MISEFAGTLSLNISKKKNEYGCYKYVPSLNWLSNLKRQNIYIGENIGTVQITKTLEYGDISLILRWPHQKASWYSGKWVHLLTIQWRKIKTK